MAIPGFSKEFLKAQIDGVRDTIGREISVYTPSTTACPLCVASGYYDPVTNTSYYTVCPICAGSYWRATVDATQVLARVHWVSNEAINYTPGGKFFVGDAQITVDPSYRTLLESAQNQAGKVVVDGQDMEIIRINPMGAPEVNRIRAVLRGMGKRPENG